VRDPLHIPGNVWLKDRFKRHSIQVSVPHVHGIFRGMLAGPEQTGVALVLGRLLPGGAGKQGLAAGLISLWDAIADAYRKRGIFPPAIGRRPAGDKGNRALVEDILDLCDGFVEGYELAGGCTGGEEGGKGDPPPEVEDLLYDFDLLLRAFDELDGEIGKEGIVKAQTRLLYQGLARLEDHFREVARASRERALPAADPSAARKGKRRLRRGRD
jgi:hypothetical protein